MSLRVRIAFVLAALLGPGPGESIAAVACPPELSGAGHATFYDATGAACSLPVAAGEAVVAVSPALFAGSARCGECLEVTGPAGSVVVRVVDQCPGCEPEDLDLSASAFAQIGNPAVGREPVSWTRVACPVSGPLTFRFSAASNEFFLQVQAIDHRYGIASMDLVAGDSLQPMARTAYNLFELSPSPPAHDVTVRVTATSGESILQHLGDPRSPGPIAGVAQFSPCAAEVFADGFEGM